MPLGLIYFSVSVDDLSAIGLRAFGWGADGDGRGKSLVCELILEGRLSIVRLLTAFSVCMSRHIGSYD